MASSSVMFSMTCTAARIESSVSIGARFSSSLVYKTKVVSLGSMGTELVKCMSADGTHRGIKGPVTVMTTGFLDLRCREPVPGGDLWATVPPWRRSKEDRTDEIHVAPALLPGRELLGADA